MAKIAILSDIHSNLHALRAVLKDVRSTGADDIVIAGDTVGYGANPGACVELVRKIGCGGVLGNHDFYTLQLLKNPNLLPPDLRTTNPVWAGVAHAADTLTSEQVDWLRALPITLELPGAMVCHAALHEMETWPYLHTLEDTRPTLRQLRKMDIGLGFFGHTHRQDLFADGAAPDLPEFLQDRRVRIPPGAICAILVGSVGQPRDGDLRAGWVLWDSDERIVEFRRTEYAACAAAEDILAAGLPESSAHRLVEPAQIHLLRSTRGRKSTLGEK